MKAKIKDFMFWFLINTAVVLLIAFCLICIGWSIYAFVKYGNKPISEVPSWALWFMFGGGNR